MNCPKCNSEKAIVQMVQSSEKTKRKGVGLGGHLNNAARATTAVMTLGMSNLVWKKSEGGNSTKIKNNAVAVCQDCGNTWTTS